MLETAIAQLRFMTEERGDRRRAPEAEQAAARKEALLARYEPLSAKAKRQQRAEEAFLAADGQNAFSAQSQAQAIRVLCDANALVDHYRELLIEIGHATELADLAWLDV